MRFARHIDTGKGGQVAIAPYPLAVSIVEIGFARSVVFRSLAVPRFMPFCPSLTDRCRVFDACCDILLGRENPGNAENVEAMSSLPHAETNPEQRTPPGPDRGRGHRQPALAVSY
jgi:hypothetical protein